VSLVVTRWYYKLYILTRDVTAIYSSSPSRNIAKRRKNLSKVQVLGGGGIKERSRCNRYASILCPVYYV